MDLNEEAWELVKQWRLAASKYKEKYKNESPNFEAYLATMLEFCATDLEDILNENVQTVNKK